ncbi:short-chain protein [Apiospora rasikravindrae]|uniref:Short-chain protein n=1 Tax=Apiospora rasikravindrae TaxID=990691 RepID=A0ABR1TDM8_9PEZI
MTTTPQGTIFVTGANGGLGSAIVDRIVRDPTLAANYHSLYTVRNPQRAAAVQKVLQHAKATGHSHDLVPLDLSSLASVRAAAADVNQRVATGTLPRIRALVLNAGWQEYTTQTWTADGYDQAFQANYLSHFLLTLLLLESMDQDRGRIVVLGSWSHDTTDKRNTMGPTGTTYTSEERYRQIFGGPGQPMDTEKVATGKWSSTVEHPDDACAGFRRYGASKLAQVMMMRELSKRIASDPALPALTVVGLDPGAMPSNLIRERGTPLLRFMADWLMPWLVPIMAWFQPNGDFRTTAQSARDVLHAAGFFSSDGGDDNNASTSRKLNGTYFNGSAVGDVGPEAKDDVKYKTLWTNGIRFAEVQEGDTALTDWR